MPTPETNRTPERPGRMLLIHTVIDTHGRLATELLQGCGIDSGSIDDTDDDLLETVLADKIVSSVEYDDVGVHDIPILDATKIRFIKSGLWPNEVKMVSYPAKIREDVRLAYTHSKVLILERYDETDASLGEAYVFINADMPPIAIDVDAAGEAEHMYDRRGLGEMHPMVTDYIERLGRTGTYELLGDKTCSMLVATMNSLSPRLTETTE